MDDEKNTAPSGKKTLKFIKSVFGKVGRILRFLYVKTRSIAGLARKVLFPAGTVSVKDDLKKAFAHIDPQKAILSFVAGVVIIYALTGIYIVNPGEQAVIRRFGAVFGVPVSEGIHYRLPWPVDRVQKVNVSEVRRADVGVNLPDHMHTDDAPSDVQLLTADENIVSAAAIVHYKVKDAVKFLYNVNFDDEQLVRSSAEAALVKTLANIAVDNVLSTEKVRAQTSVLQQAQEILDRYESGIQITAFNIQGIVPPGAVADAFRDVTAAREDGEREVNQARGYYNSMIPGARGRANDTITKADAYKIETVNRAVGESQKFEAVLLEYQRDSQVYSQNATKYRLLLETLEKTLPRVKKYIIDSSNKEVNVKLFDPKFGAARE
jgi:membrane protease subunit HflK